ncbi:hypothetical protein OQA88_3340 [Cercophora sp. LCS_1]
MDPSPTPNPEGPAPDDTPLEIEEDDQEDEEESEINPLPNRNPWVYQIMYNKKRKVLQLVKGPIFLPPFTIWGRNAHLIEIASVAMTSTANNFDVPLLERLEVPIVGFEFTGRIKGWGNVPSHHKAPGEDLYVYGYTSTVRVGNARSYSIVPTSELCHMPLGMGDEAAAYPINFLTAYDGLFGYGLVCGPNTTDVEGWKKAINMNASRKILITHAHTPVGIFAVQLAKLQGIGHIEATCDETKIAFVKRLGAHVVHDCNRHPGDLMNLGYLAGGSVFFSGVFDTARGETTRRAVPLAEKVVTTREVTVDMSFTDRSKVYLVQARMSNSKLRKLGEYIQMAGKDPGFILPEKSPKYAADKPGQLLEGWRHLRRIPPHNKVLFTFKATRMIREMSLPRQKEQEDKEVKEVHPRGPVFTRIMNKLAVLKTRTQWLDIVRASPLANPDRLSKRRVHRLSGGVQRTRQNTIYDLKSASPHIYDGPWKKLPQVIDAYPTIYNLRPAPHDIYDGPCDETRREKEKEERHLTQNPPTGSKPNLPPATQTEKPEPPKGGSEGTGSRVSEDTSSREDTRAADDNNALETARGLVELLASEARAELESRRTSGEQIERNGLELEAQSRLLKLFRGTIRRTGYLG